jgi:sugar lactone lactonase YvrE
MRFRLVQTIACPAAALCVDREDILWAASGREVRSFDAAGAPLRRWPAAGPVTAIAVSPGGHVFAGQQGRVEIFDRAGKLIRAWAGELLGHVTAIGFTRDSILAADAKDRSIHCFDNALAFRRDIGKDNRTKGFLIPNGSLDFTVDPRGVIHACNPGKHRVERYTAAGELLGHIGRFDGLDPEGFTGCCNPTNVALDAKGRVFVTEKAEPRAKVLSPEGRLLGIISTSFDPAAKNMAIAVNSRGRVFVADAAAGKILVFEEES